MRRVLVTGAALVALLGAGSFAGETLAVEAGPGASASNGDRPAAEPWDDTTLEAVPALALDGRVGDGERAFEMCSHCHLPSAAGRPDGSVPQIAGQHTSVLIKQMSDIREGRRENPIMYPFARTVISPQKLADLAAYIETLPIPRQNGKGPGTSLELGRTLYERDCGGCHMPDGRGSARTFVPVLAGQHYEYLLRQIRDLATEWRHNAHPEMNMPISSYTQDEIVAVADYVSRLEWPERQQQD
jgi:cytochrome c553